MASRAAGCRLNQLFILNRCWPVLAQQAEASEELIAYTALRLVCIMRPWCCACCMDARLAKQDDASEMHSVLPSAE